MSLMEFAILFESHYSKVSAEEDDGDQDAFDHVPVFKH